MEIVGWVFIGVIALTVFTAVVFGILSFPEALRYLKIRRM